MEVLTVKISQQLRARLQKIASEHGVTMSALARDILSESINRRDVQSALASLEGQIKALTSGQAQWQQDQLRAIRGLVDALNEQNKGQTRLSGPETFADYKARTQNK